MIFIKKLLAIITCMVVFSVCIPFTASAETGTYGDLTYVLLGNEITITDYVDTATEVEIPSEINGYPVTKIGENAFTRSLITKIVIPDSVKLIAPFAFNYCEDLEEVVMSDSVKEIGVFAFEGCHSLKSVTLSNSLKILNAGVFQYCRSLESIEIPNSVASIEFVAFGGCESLTSITIPYSTRIIKFVAFMDCYNLQKIIIKSPDLTLEESAFDDCYELSEIVFPDEYECSFTAKASFTFCRKLNSVTIPKTVIYLSDSAFLQSNIETINGCIYGYRGTVAEEYANSHYIAFKRTMNFIALDEEVVETETTPVSETDTTQTDTTITETQVSTESVSETSTLGTEETTSITDITTETQCTESETTTITDTTTSEITETEKPVKGDVNEDGEIDICDIITLRKYAINCQDEIIINFQAADINNDGKINVFDIVMLKKMLLW